MNLFWLRPSALQVWAVDTTEIQITWGHLPAGKVSASAADTRVEIPHAGGAGSLVLGDLPSGTRLEVSVRSEGGTYHRLQATTLTPPAGEILSRVATISDLHLGSNNWGFLKTIDDIGAFPDRYDVRCADAAVHEARQWGLDLLVIKGDAAHHRRLRDYEILGAFVDRFPSIEMMLVAGNHDVDSKTQAELPATVGERKLGYNTSVETKDLAGVRIILGDTTIDNIGRGTVKRIKDDVLKQAADAPDDATTMVALHHQMQRFPVATYWPPGVSGPEANDFLKSLVDVQPRAFVTSGHTHRNRSRTAHGLMLTEVASTKDWPGVWAGYTFYEGGFTQVVRRVAHPDAISWTEYSRKALLGLWAPWSPGPLQQRCFSLSH